MLTRREFIGSALLPLVSAQERSQPLRVAIITTIYKYLSHGQHIGDRFLIGYPIDGEWHKPNVKVVSLYVDQKPEGDLSQERASEFGFRYFGIGERRKHRLTARARRQMPLEFIAARNLC